MIALLPLCRTDLHGPLDESALAALVRASARCLAAAQPRCRAWLCSDMPLQGLAQSLGLGFVAVQPDQETGPLPAGALSALAALEPDAAADPVLVLSPLYPLLGPEDVNQALQSYESGQGPTISVSKPADHPCQLRAYFRIQDKGLVQLLDPAVATRGVLRSLPLDWHRGQAPGLTKETGQWRIQIAEQACRDLLPPGLRNATILGVGFPDASGCPRALLVQPDGNSGPQLLVANSAAAQAIALLPGSAAPFLVDLPESPDLLPVPPEAVTGKGLCYFLLQHAGSGSYDICLPFSPNLPLWGYTPDGKRVRHQAGTVTGRQGFPDIFQLESALFIGRAEELRLLPQLLESGRTVGVDLPQERLITYATLVGRLRCLDRLAAREAA